MGPSDSSHVATSGNAEHGPPFLTLPTEIREMIYRPLLVAKYTMTEHSMTSKEVSLSTAKCFIYTDRIIHSTTETGATYNMVLIKPTGFTPQFSARTARFTKKRAIFVGVRTTSSA